MKQFRACIVGGGFVGAAQIEALRRLGNVEIAAVSNRHDPQAKAEALFVPKGYADYREMLEAEKPDVVHICTPNDSHYEIAMFAMQRGIHVICEKPMTRTLDEARSLAEYACAHNIINAVNDSYVLTHFWFVWIPAGFLILITVLGFNFVGDGLRDAFDPKMKR